MNLTLTKYKKQQRILSGVPEEKTLRHRPFASKSPASFSPLPLSLSNQTKNRRPIFPLLTPSPQPKATKEERRSFTVRRRERERAVQRDRMYRSGRRSGGLPAEKETRVMEREIR
jgi:hypothetical protein